MVSSNVFLPTSAKEVAVRGWEELDVILFSGDAYVDHPAFGAAVIGRLLEAEGYRVAIVPQPNWRDDLRDFRKLGKPRLFFGVTAGAMDSMVNHYTATRRLRSDDAYTPGGRAGQRPDYPTIVYTQILKRLYPGVPVIVGGIEASLRRLTHYDYWQDRLRPSFLVESGADLLTYGMGDRVIVEIARALHNGFNLKRLSRLGQVAYLSDSLPEGGVGVAPVRGVSAKSRKIRRKFHAYRNRVQQNAGADIGGTCGRTIRGGQSSLSLPDGGRNRP